MNDKTRRAFLKRAAAATIAGGVVGAALPPTASGEAAVEKKPQPLTNDSELAWDAVLSCFSRNEAPARR